MRPNSGIGHPGIQAPFGIYETAEGRYISIAMSPFKTLYETLSAPHLARYDELSALFEKRDEVWREVNRETKKYASAELLQRLLAADIWCAPVNTLREAANDPQVRHLKLIQTIEHPRAGALKVVAPAVSLDKTPARMTRPPPLVGEHGREILAELGIDAQQIAALEASGALTVTTHEPP